jgi:hypothetical protein
MAFEAIRSVASHANRTMAEKETEEAALELMDKWEGTVLHGKEGEFHCASVRCVSNSVLAGVRVGWHAAAGE